MIFLKLGGSLITQKSVPEAARQEALERLAGEIAEAIKARPGLRLVVGHGSGSFGHSVALRYGTHQGASSPAEWSGFADVWHVAARLNRLVVDSLRNAGLLVIAFPPSASTVCEAGHILEMAVEPIERTLQTGLLPVVAGDVALDRTWGATIVSTEQVFSYLARFLRPTRVLLAGIEHGVFADYPENAELLPVVTENDLTRISLGGATSPDVTGGMADKVRQALDLARALPGLEVRIFSGEEPGLVTAALLGGKPGTLVKGNDSSP